ncbi:TetR/AcrR family transcriptional regulator [Sphaerisporangium dianthi]|uniref:TetR/AcrR family transcriptional regulator n=1 Tax=Sphaerisporangium dianthi TaxID=1436120 RepID=A0ABV9CMA3_9ACTN
MSEISGDRPRRRRRSDADRSAAAVLGAAVRVLGRRPDASVEEIAAAAGVARQTVYAHYPSRQALLSAVIGRITDHVIAAIDAADIDAGPATAALLRWLDTSWRLLERYPLLLHPSVATSDPQKSYESHVPITDRLRRLIRRGQDTGEFDPALSPTWLLAATMALGHAAGDEVAAGRMTSAQAGEALRESVRRLYKTAD